MLLRLHPDLRPLIADALRAPQPPVTAETLDAQRRRSEAFAKPVRDDVPIAERIVPAADPVRIYVVNAADGARRPGILHMHSGGFISGSAGRDLRTLQDMALALGCTIVTVDYRLAPETTWRGSLEDNYAALRWLYANAAELGVDAERIAVMGESAGGGHAALLAITARDRGEVPIAFQCLTYPMLDDRTGSSRRAPAHIGAFGWTEASNRFAWSSFLGQEAGGAGVPRDAAPARARSLEGLPPTWIGVGDLDLFVLENLAFAQRLVTAGVPTEFHLVPGAFHGFDVIAEGVPVVEAFCRARLAALRRGLGLPIAEPDLREGRSGRPSAGRSGRGDAGVLEETS